MTTSTRKSRADDAPFDFNLDAVEAEIDLTPWRVHYGGKRWEFKHPQEIDTWDVMAWDEPGKSLTDAAAMVGVFKAALGDKQYAEFRKIPLPMHKLQALFKAYQEYGGVEAGESPGSTGS